MREAISRALWEEMERDPSVFILGEEVGVWGGTYAVTKGFYDHFGPQRVRDTPIAEAAIVGAAIGAALTGLRPLPWIEGGRSRNAGRRQGSSQGSHPLGRPNLVHRTCYHVPGTRRGS